jgi:hypothetical protein
MEFELKFITDYGQFYIDQNSKNTGFEKFPLTKHSLTDLQWRWNYLRRIANDEGKVNFEFEI